MLQHGKRPTIASRHGMVAAAHPLAAAAGARILANGGNAFDAAVATAAALNVVEPYMSGLAGRGVATCYIASEKRVRTLDFVGPISKNFPIDKLSNRSQLQRGALAVGAPGNLAGWCELNSTPRQEEAAGTLRARDRHRARRLPAHRIQHRGDPGRRRRTGRTQGAASRMVARLHGRRAAT